MKHVVVAIGFALAVSMSCAVTFASSTPPPASSGDTSEYFAPTMDDSVYTNKKGVGQGVKGKQKCVEGDKNCKDK